MLEHQFQKDMEAFQKQHERSQDVAAGKHHEEQLL